MYATLGIRSLAGGNWKTLQPSNLLMPTMSQVTTISHIENIIVEGNGSVASWRGQEPNESEPDSVFIFIIAIATISVASFASIVVIFVNHHRQRNRENLRRTISYISGHKCMAQTRNRTARVSCNWSLIGYFDWADRVFVKGIWFTTIVSSGFKFTVFSVCRRLTMRRRWCGQVACSLCYVGKLGASIAKYIIIFKLKKIVSYMWN